MILLQHVLFEDIETKGSTYETQVIDSLVAAGLASSGDAAGAGSNRYTEDATFTLQDNEGNEVGPFKLELKKDFKAQLGGSSWDISDPKNVRFLANVGSSRAMIKAHDEMKEVLEQALGTGGALKRLRRFLKNFKAGTHEINGVKFKETKEGEAYNLAGDGLKCTRLAWAAAQASNLLFNYDVVAHSKFMTTLYSQKATYYAQIGGKDNSHRGLYILGHDPANLAAIGVPRLSSLAAKNKFFIEMRSTPGGSSTYLYVRIRCQGRLIVTTPVPKDYSPFTLDTPEGAKRLAQTYMEQSPPRRAYLQKESVETNEASENVEIVSMNPSDEPLEDGTEAFTSDNVDLDWLAQGGYTPIT